MKVSALMPVKSFRNAKQRLSPLLGVAQRERLAEVMFREVLSQVLGARGLAEAFVVTGDDQVAEIARSLGAQVIREEAERGETEAVDFARLELKTSGREAVLIVPGDLPLVRSTDIEAVLAQIPGGASPPFALLVPSHDRMGTNALLLAPPDLIQLRFGYDSFSYHMRQVAVRALPLRFVENDGIGLDIDEPKDLDRLLSLGFEESETDRLVRGILAGKEARRVGSFGGL
jgi:2-phospho-L-lactate/phosphoenolpyruvate guanylyltransferase